MRVKFAARTEDVEYTSEVQVGVITVQHCKNGLAFVIVRGAGILAVPDAFVPINRAIRELLDQREIA
jgi:hypothetical protein